MAANPPPLRHVLRVKKLYKTILKLHKNLPPDLADLGTKYTRDEFKRHKTCTPMESAVFMSEWAVRNYNNIHNIIIFIILC